MSLAQLRIFFTIGLAFCTVVINFPARSYYMVDVAQLVEPRFVVPVVAGSSPVIHPIFSYGNNPRKAVNYAQ